LSIRVLFFDLDGTLVYHPTGSEVERLMEIFRELGLFFDRELVREAHKVAEEWWERNVKSYLDRDRESFIKYYRIILEHLGVRWNRNLLAERVQFGWEETPDNLYPEVTRVLLDLKKKGLRFGIVSGRYLPTIQNTLRRHGIASFFTCLISPFEAHAPKGKLDKKLWTFALQNIGAKTEEAAHVGDDPETDVKGAQKAGLFPILVDRKSRYKGVDCTRIRDLTQLPPIVHPEKYRDACAECV
jgi:HAD superfamily hydrolase (TIGR01549 family)